MGRGQRLDLTYTPSRGRQQRLPAAERTRQILDAAVDVFSVQGYRSSAFREVADACDVTEPLIYKYFRSRKELFLETIRHAAELVLDAWQGAASARPDSLSKLRALGDVEMARRVCRLSGGVLLQARADAGHDEDVSRAVSHGMGMRLGFVTGLVKEAQGDGLIRGDVDTVELAWQVLSILISTSVIAQFDVGFPCPSRLIDLVLSRVVTEQGLEILGAVKVAA